MNAALKTRAKLSVPQVVDIFQLKKDLSAQSAAQVARQYEVSEKTVRDIWAGRTWTSETWHLDTTRILHHKHIGRPKGCRDSKPRKHRSKQVVSETRQLSSKIKRIRPDDQQPGISLDSARCSPSNQAPKYEMIEKTKDNNPERRGGKNHPPRKILASTVSSSSGESVDQQLFEWELASRSPAAHAHHASDSAQHTQLAAKHRRNMPWPGRM
jgi:hypothetical protein